MNNLSLAFFLALASGCAADSSPLPESSTPVETPDGTGGGTDERPSDLELLRREASDAYRFASSDMVLDRYDDSWVLEPGEEFPTESWFEGDDLMLDTLFRVEQSPTCDEDLKWSVVVGLVENCNFGDIDKVLDPLAVASPYEIDEYGNGDLHYVRVEFENFADECDGTGNKLGFAALPITYYREGNQIQEVRGAQYPLLGCIEDGVVDWAAPLASTEATSELIHNLLAAFKWEADALTLE